MGTKLQLDSLAEALFGKTRRRVLALFFTRPEESFFLREVVAAVSSGRGAVQRELARLSEAGILERVTRGRQVHFQANPNCPLFPELSNLMLKTAGLSSLLQEALLPLSDRISLAFIYGSLARGETGLHSDVDVLIVGKVSLLEVVSAVSSIQEKINREVNPSVYSEVEFTRKAKDRDHFFHTILNQPKMFLIGDEDELADLVK